MHSKRPWNIFTNGAILLTHCSLSSFHFECQCNLHTNTNLYCKYTAGIQYEIEWHLPRPHEIALSEAKCWGNLHNSCCASWHAMHNGNVEWKVLARYIDRRWERKSCWHERRWREERRKDVEKMSSDECEENRLWHSLLIRSLSAAFSRFLFSLFHPPPSTSFLLCFSLLSHYTHFSHPSSHCVLQIPLFIPSSLSLSWEAHVRSIYHHLSRFIWSGGLISGLGCCASGSSQTYLTEADKYSITFSD